MFPLVLKNLLEDIGFGWTMRGRCRRRPNSNKPLTVLLQCSPLLASVL